MGKMKKNDDLFQIVQFFEIVLVLLVIYVIAISEPFFLDMHVFCSTIGWLLLMVQGLLVFRGINPIVRKLMGKDTVFIHWVMETIALIGATIAVVSIYQAKNKLNWQHFVTWHGIFGLIGFLSSLLSGLIGVPTLYRKELKNYISPQLSKFVHILTGTVGFFFGGLSLILSFYTKWYRMRTSNSLLSLCIALFLVTSVVIFTLIRPVNKVRENWRKLTVKD